MPSGRASIQAPWLGTRTEVEGLQRYLRTLRERWLVVLACVVLALAGAGAYVALAHKRYQATSQLLVTPLDSADPNTVGLGLITTSNDPGRDVATAASLVTLTPVARGVINQLGLTTTPRKVLQDVTAVPLANTSLVSVTATASSPNAAKALADAFAQQTISQRTARLHSEEDATIGLLRAESATQPNHQLPQGLAARLTTLQSLRAQGDPTLSISSLADVPTSPSSPRRYVSLAAGLLGGLILGLGAALLLQNVDPRLRREEQLRDVFRLPILARIPREPASRRPAPLVPDRLTPVTAEAFRSLRATLAASHTDSPTGTSVLVTGASPSEGKSTTALNLAYSLTQAGYRVILIETDVHRPGLREALDVDLRFGLISVLTGHATLHDALVSVPAYGPDLQLLLVERPEPTAADRLALPVAQRIIAEARQMAHFVIIDSPPLGEITDTLPLARTVDSVLIVTRLRTTRLKVLTELGELLAQNGIEPLGIALVGVERSTSGGYYYRGNGSGVRAPRASETAV